LLTHPLKPVPHAFVLEALAPLSPYTRPIFGCLAVYVKDKIVLILRDKPTNASDNGVWLATTRDHHDGLRREFPNMRSIQVLGKPVTGWQILPADAADFEAAAQHACDLVLAGDARIGKVPGARRASASKPKEPVESLKRSKESNTSLNVKHAVWLMRLSYLRYALKIASDPRRALDEYAEELQLNSKLKSLLEPFVPRLAVA
jgi:hypothetical protein